ncbi:hypothetical protein GCM10028819_51460 [Spirosoma humi]
MESQTTAPDRFTAANGDLWISIVIRGVKHYRVVFKIVSPLNRTGRLATEKEALETYLKTNSTFSVSDLNKLDTENANEHISKHGSNSSSSRFSAIYGEVVTEMDKTQEPNSPQASSHQKAESKEKDEWLISLLEREQLLSDIATKPVVFSPALIKRGEAGIIGRGTINIIQGAYGSHKSRLAELFASMMLARDDEDPNFLVFYKQTQEKFCVCYIDTERNLNEELPSAIQNIKLNAGFALEAQPKDFRFTSIKAIERPYRFGAIECFLRDVRENTKLHLFCLIDVVTDAIGDFNDSRESMKLFDFLGNLCDNYDATFMLVIHQNPGTEKARGHTGTEAANKASTALQIALERDANGNETDIIKLRYLKLRRGKRPEAVLLQFSKEENRLVLADASQVAAHNNQRKHKADIEDITDRLVSLLTEGPMPKGEVHKKLQDEFDANNSTIRDRLKTIKEERPAMYNEDGRPVVLGEFRKGRDQFYQLNPSC